MSINLTLLILSAFLAGAGTFMLMSRNLSRVLFGILIFGNALNIFMITVSGPAGIPPIKGIVTNSYKNVADPLAQAMVLTGIVIPMGLIGFCLALLYRYVKITNSEKITDEEKSTIDTDFTDSENDLIDVEANDSDTNNSAEATSENGKS